MLKFEQSVNNAGDHRVTFVINVEGDHYEMVGFLNSACTKFEFAKNEVSHLSNFIEERVVPYMKESLKDARIAELEKQLKALKG